jgi:hypothetical protein
MAEIFPTVKMGPIQIHERKNGTSRKHQMKYNSNKFNPKFMVMLILKHKLEFWMY